MEYSIDRFSRLGLWFWKIVATPFFSGVLVAIDLLHTRLSYTEARCIEREVDNFKARIAGGRQLEQLLAEGLSEAKLPATRKFYVRAYLTGIDNLDRELRQDRPLDFEEQQASSQQEAA